MPDPVTPTRRFPRYQADLPATVYLDTGVAQVRLINISRGGVLIFPPLPSQQPPPIRISIELDDGRPPINCKGEIIYTINDRGTGVAFTEISVYNRDRITAYFEKKVLRQTADSQPAKTTARRDV